MGYPNMDIYERFAADPNKERALDNFLVFNGNKHKAKILPEETVILHSIGMWEDAVTGSIALRKTTWGYAEATLEVTEGEKWFKLTQTKAGGGDFDRDNAAQIHYMILPREMGEARETALVTLKAGGDEFKIYVYCSPAAAFEAHLDRQTFGFDDEGKLHIKNNMGRDLMVDISSEAFVRFEAQRYLIGKNAEIDFAVKYSSFKAATLIFKRHLAVQTFINIVAIDSGRSFARKMKLEVRGN